MAESKSIPLDDLLQKVTPLLPFKVDEAKQNAIVAGKYTLRPHWDGCGLVAEMDAVSAYAVHAANVLPKLVEALGECKSQMMCVADSPPEFKNAWTKAHQAITAANNVSVL